MVYKKYLKKDGKTFGPYYYESYRAGTKVKKLYIGGEKEYKVWLKNKKDKKLSKKPTPKRKSKDVPGKFLFFLFLTCLVLVVGSNILSIANSSQFNFIGHVISEDVPDSEDGGLAYEIYEEEVVEEAAEEEVVEDSGGIYEVYEEIVEEISEVPEDVVEVSGEDSETNITEVVEEPEINITEETSETNVTEIVGGVAEINVTEEIQEEVNESNINENISLTNETISNVKEPNVTEMNIIELNVTESNITFTNETVSNQTITNVTLKQHRIVINRPVKWHKKLNGNLSKLKIELPKDVENVSVVVGDDVEEKEQNAVDEEEIIEEDKTSLITGNVFLEIDDDPGLLVNLWEWLTKYFTGITGFVIQINDEEVIVDISEISNSTIVDIETEVAEEEILIEYYTEAPTSNESEIENGKRVEINGPDEFHYEDVLAYTEFDNSLGIINSNYINLYWYNNERTC